MKFKINDSEWEIIELPQKEMKEELPKHYFKAEEQTRYFGETYSDTHKIYLDKELCHDEKRRTLFHELMHCYISSYLHSCDNYGEEILCDVSANSHDIIHKIVGDYFK